eukprot:m.8627 g.8627  ORF g.8627 m.8627 type:complete len:718 (-) comp6622_c0_seq2:245-2398(-)
MISHGKHIRKGAEHTIMTPDAASIEAASQLLSFAQSITPQQPMPCATSPNRSADLGTFVSAFSPLQSQSRGSETTPSINSMNSKIPQFSTQRILQGNASRKHASEEDSYDSDEKILIPRKRAKKRKKNHVEQSVQVNFAEITEKDNLNFPECKEDCGRGGIIQELEKYCNSLQPLLNASLHKVLADYRTVLERTAKLENEAYGATQYTSYDVRMALADAMRHAAAGVARALRPQTTEAAMVAKAAFVKVKARKDSLQRSPVHQACAIGDIDKLKMLITEHVDIDCQSADGYTPLYFAVKNNHLAVVEFLLDNGADVSVRCGTHLSPPLYEATKQNNADIVRTLIKNGAQTTQRTGAGASVFDLPVNIRMWSILKNTPGLALDAATPTDPISAGAADTACTTPHSDANAGGACDTADACGTVPTRVNPPSALFCTPPNSADATVHQRTNDTRDRTARCRVRPTRRLPAAKSMSTDTDGAMTTAATDAGDVQRGLDGTKDAESTPQHNACTATTPLSGSLGVSAVPGSVITPDAGGVPGGGASSGSAGARPPVVKCNARKLFVGKSPQASAASASGGVKPLVWKCQDFDVHTEFFLGKSANDALQLSGRGRLWGKHKEIFRHSCSKAEKQFLLDHGKAPRTVGLKATLVLASQIRALARDHPHYAGNKQIQHNVAALPAFTLNERTLKSMKRDIRVKYNLPESSSLSGEARQGDDCAAA